MAFEWVSYFECTACGGLERADAVGYDSLGYPECPNCGTRTGPLAGSGHGTWTGSEALD
ncbi:hypothetical protein GL213_10585 [Halogeometricum borinquense]|uniref:Small CPxCG-related zinc finger protein n=1 Tax=Halogeometricum borinquense (strain ATCC 700274 / DSM 11551 / JCM 10706 / KCTC 4070 / PR3) TaxID=469382 RepID=E4NPM6_HALBP|nr:hypothetical protein [Halogeometricum borinquense]ADQ67696.1 hypothetical protein Hbor_21320 [Halogeometricum borinquense DSM 11551]ELY23623.1 hypothetical protein C499_17769 [Halogeometricum borinquense DSM 11551]QIQ76926.1 hypothetical protein GL213_10585 [Halogeometricum borinquense]